MLGVAAVRLECGVWSVDVDVVAGAAGVGNASGRNMREWRGGVRFIEGGWGR